MTRLETREQTLLSAASIIRCWQPSLALGLLSDLCLFGGRLRSGLDTRAGPLPHFQPQVMCAASEASLITHSSSSRCSKIGTYTYGAPCTTLRPDEHERAQRSGCLAEFSLHSLCRACPKCRRGGTERASSLPPPSRCAHTANMFSRHRNSSQRPNDGMLAQFKQSFPSGSSQAAAVENAVAADHGMLDVNTSAAVDAHLQPTRYYGCSQSCTSTLTSMTAINPSPTAL